LFSVLKGCECLIPFNFTSDSLNRNEMQNYINIDQQLHQLSQTIAKVNRTFVETKEDDSHTNLYFDPISCRIYGHWMGADQNQIILTLNLTNSEFEWLDTKWDVIQSIGISGKTQSQIELEIHGMLVDLKLDSKNFMAEMHYEIPDYGLENKEWAPLSMSCVKEWVKWRSIANNASNMVTGSLQGTTDVRIWPHHFDTGIYLGANAKTGIGFGMAMQDSMVGAPYFYCTGSNLNGDELEYAHMPDLTFGHWVVGGTWNGAVLSLLDLSENEMVKIRTFISETVACYLKKSI
jgi:hypothetical protein